MKKIALHTTVYCNTTTIISTVQLTSDIFETMVLFEDGTELECIRTNTLEDAKKTHNRVMNEWNDKVYNGGIAKLLGVPNVGQFVKTEIAC